MLTKDDIQLLLKLLNLRIVVNHSSDFPFYIFKEGTGYNMEDDNIAQLQAKLSVMLAAQMD